MLFLENKPVLLKYHMLYEDVLSIGWTTRLENHAFYLSSSVYSLYLSMVYCLLPVVICVLLVPWYGILLTISHHLCNPCTLVWYTDYYQSSSVYSMYLSMVYWLLSVIICVLLVPWYGILLTISHHLCTPCTLVLYTAYYQSSSVYSLYLSMVYCLLSVIICVLLVP